MILPMAGDRSDFRIRSLPSVQAALLAWHADRAAFAPWRESRDPYQCLVAAVMAQQTQMSRVLVLYDRFTAAFPTVDALAAASLGDVIRAWKGMGYNQRAVRLHRAARHIVAHGWPRDAASLRPIEGIGPFTAAIIASFAFGEPAACVDTNVRRVLGRLAGAPEIAPAALQRLADASISREHPARWNQAVMDYGAAVCAPRPRCDVCVVARWCASRTSFAAGTRVAESRATYDVKPPRPAKREAPFEGSPRYFRGRIIDVLRELPPGESIPVRRIPKLIANSHAAPSQPEVAELLAQLERQGLAIVVRGRAALPA
jgi:A/G-specific adenine glycosylase